MQLHQGRPRLCETAAGLRWVPLAPLETHAHSVVRSGLPEALALGTPFALLAAAAAAAAAAHERCTLLVRQACFRVSRPAAVSAPLLGAIAVSSRALVAAARDYKAEAARGAITEVEEDAERNHPLCDVPGERKRRQAHREHQHRRCSEAERLHTAMGLSIHQVLAQQTVRVSARWVRRTKLERRTCVNVSARRVRQARAPVQCLSSPVQCIRWAWRRCGRGSGPPPQRGSTRVPA